MLGTDGKDSTLKTDNPGFAELKVWPVQRTAVERMEQTLGHNIAWVRAGLLTTRISLTFSQAST